MASGDDTQRQVPVTQPALPAAVPAVQGGATTAGTAPAQATLPPQRIYRRRLANLRNVRCALADALRDLEAGTMEPGKARVLICRAHPDSGRGDSHSQKCLGVAVGLDDTPKDMTGTDQVRSAALVFKQDHKNLWRQLLREELERRPRKERGRNPFGFPRDPGLFTGGVYGTRTRGLRRDRPAL